MFFPGCGFPAWHGHDHKAMASRFTDDGSSYCFWVVFQGVVFQPGMSMATNLWHSDLQMMGQSSSSYLWVVLQDVVSYGFHL